MPNPHKKHPYSGRPNSDYLTVVLERIEGRQPDEAMRDSLFNSLTSGKECTALPGYSVTALSIGDELSEQEYREEQEGS